MQSICPYCRAPVLPEESATTCEGCGTPHHSECYAENAGCTVFGCKFAPADDPKLQVTTVEVAQAAAPSYAPVGTGFGDVSAPSAIAVVPRVAPPPPPPPPPGTVTQPPPEPQTPQRSLVPAASILLSATERPRVAKSRLAFILLGIFLGSFGVHNFYAGYTKRGIAQLCVTLGTVFYGSFVTWAWALIEVCTVDRDHNDVAFV